MFARFIAWLRGEVMDGEAHLANALKSFDAILAHLEHAAAKLATEIGESMEAEAALLDAADAEMIRRDGLVVSHEKAVAVGSKIRGLVS
jgi:hypothetical protein